MGYRVYGWAILLPLAFIYQTCQGQRYTNQGAAVGGVTGAVIGGLLGKQNDRTTGGALIGGAIGAVAGGAMGNSYDQTMARQRYSYENALYAQQQQFYAQQYAQAQSGVTPADVVSMSRSGVNENVIISQLSSRGIQRRLEVSDIISLHQQGVSESLISAMQAAPLSSQLGAPGPYGQPSVHNAPPVIVRQPRVIYSAPPPVIYEHYYYPAFRPGVTIRGGF